VCVGAAFAQVEAALIIARVMRDFDFVPSDPSSVAPASRLTTRPRRAIVGLVQRRTR
jgi:cytochrome P450